MSCVELNTSCTREAAITILDRFRQFVITNCTDSIWRAEERRSENRALGFPEDEVCRIDMINPETHQVMCILSMAFQSRMGGVSLANITPTKQLGMNPIPDTIYNEIAVKFNSEVWQPFLKIGNWNE